MNAVSPSIIDPASRWVYSEIAPQRAAPTPQDSRAVVINGLLSLRGGILEYDGANKSNVFDSDGALVRPLRRTSAGPSVPTRPPRASKTPLSTS